MIRRELYSRIPGLGFYGTAASRTASTLTHTQAFQDSTLGNNHYRGYYLYMPDDTAADAVRKIASHVASTGVVTTAGPAWAVSSDLDYEVVGLVHPDEINNAIIRSLNRIYFETHVVLPGRITDGDMDANNTTSWSDVLTPTKSKVTTAGNVYSGIRALRVLNNALDEGVQSVTLRGFPANSWVYLHAVVRADVGTANLILYDVTNSVALATVTSAEEGWVHLWLRFQLASTTEEIAVQLTGNVSSTADIYWDHVALYLAEDRVFPAPSWCDDPWKLLKLREMRYTQAISSQSTGGYDAAYSRTPHDYSTPSAFTLEPFHLETNPYTIALHRPLPQHELWVQGKRPWSDIESLSTDAATTLVPLEQLYAYSTQEIAKVLTKRYPNDDRWRMLLSEASEAVEAETQARPEVPLSPKKFEYPGWI